MTYGGFEYGKTEEGAEEGGKFEMREENLRWEEERRVDGDKAFEKRDQNEEREREALFLLSNMEGMYHKRLRRMHDYAESFQEAYRLSGAHYVNAGIFKDQNAAEAHDQGKRREERLLLEYHALKEQGIRLIPFWDSAFPKRLSCIPDAPLFLYVKGRLPKDEQPSAAIIGARECSDYGRSAAVFFAKELSKRGVQIVSGLAHGIDAEAARGALSGSGESFAVLGSGVSNCYPKENYLLYEEMAEKGRGGVISEFPPRAAAKGYHFILRNRIIAGLSDVLLVIEAREKSGTGITVDYALEQGKEVFALPGRITDPLGRGCNRLLKEGAAVLSSPSDVLSFFGMEEESQIIIEEKNLAALASSEKIVYSCLDFNAKHIEELAKAAKLPLRETISVLGSLEMKGYAVSPQSAYYRKAYI